MNMKLKKVTLRSGEVRLVAPPTPPQDGLDNSLEWARANRMVVGRVQCEKMIKHHFDGTVATHMAIVKFRNSYVPVTHTLCYECCEEFMEKIAPSSDTGQKNSTPPATKAE